MKRFILTDKLYLKVFIGFSIGILLCDHFSLPIVLFICLCLLGLLQSICIVLKINRPKSIENSFFILITLFGVLFHYFNAVRSDINGNLLLKNNLSNPTSFLIRIDSKAEKKEKSYKQLGTILWMRDQNDSLIRIYQKSLLYFNQSTPVDSWHYGDYISITANLKLIDSPTYWTDFDYRKWLYRNKIYSTAYVTASKRVGHDSSMYRTIANIPLVCRDYFEQELERYILAPSSLQIAKSLLLGIRSDLDQEILDAYSNTGTIHILSVSGLHFGILIGVLGWVLGLILPKKSKITLIIKHTISLLYALMTGFSPPVLRSFIMFLLFDIQKMINIRSSSINILFFSACLILFVDTNQLFDIGFILSYAALLGIMVMYEKVEQKVAFSNYFLIYFWKSTCVMLSAWMFTLPFTIYFFHKITLLGMLSNYIVLPISTGIMYLGFILMAISRMVFLGTFIGNIISYLIFVQNQVILFFDKFPLAAIHGLYITPFELIILCSLLGFVIIFLYTKERMSYRWAIVSLFCLIVFHQSLSIHSLKQTEWQYFDLKPFGIRSFKTNRTLYLMSDSISDKTYKYSIIPYMVKNNIDSVVRLSFMSQLSVIEPESSPILSQNPHKFILCRENKSQWFDAINSMDTFLLAKNLGDYYTQKLRDTLTIQHKFVSNQ